MSNPTTVHSRRLRNIGVVITAVAASIAVSGLYIRSLESETLNNWTAEQAIPTVAVITPSSASNADSLQLPGRMEAFREAPIYARIDGYLKNWQFDIGSKIHAGDKLAVIDTPDIDQQLLQAKAQLRQSEANCDQAKATADRWLSLVKSRAVSEQETEENVSAYHAREAEVKAAKANLQYLEVQKAYADIAAPFDGVITARNTDIGDLISAGSNGGSALFEVADTSKIRVYIRVPQTYVPQIDLGTDATIHVPETPNKAYHAEVVANARSVDQQSGTTLMQLMVDNLDGGLMPGAYASVELHLKPRADVLTIPASALMFNSKGLTVATVTANNSVVIKPVTIARDLGRNIEIESGLLSTDKVIANPPDGIAQNDKVNLIRKS
ncbi:efflux RND transporter periplasmic adaptor subunit [Shewanella sp.]|uniref:efflux RND transporter periplasmic adaptor subunit n=1 Tax=Shewanella sp. TaxID=50422 RepID=UPI003A987940